MQDYCTSEEADRQHARWCDVMKLPASFQSGINQINQSLTIDWFL